jgi:hypothetical protein
MVVMFVIVRVGLKRVTSRIRTSNQASVAHLQRQSNDGNITATERLIRKYEMGRHVPCNMELTEELDNLFWTQYAALQDPVSGPNETLH